MLALFALIVIVSADTITIPIKKDDNDKYYQYFTGETGECYLVSYTEEITLKYEKKNDNLYNYTYNSLDCSGTETETEITEYKDGDGDLKPAGAYFSDGTDDCSYAKNDDYNPLKTIITDECVIIDGMTYQYETDDGHIVSKVYTDSKCEGDEYAKVTTKCDTCNEGNYVYCSSSINSIMLIALAVILMLF
ncbi:hypothetical protein QTN25_002281 [Entamoeba marina]